MQRVLTIGVVGLGYWGPNLARNFNQLPGCRLGALCDLDPKRLEIMQLLYPDTVCYVSFNQMLEDANLDAVVVATPVHQHFPLGKAALLAGKHLLIEKPLAAGTAECEELISLAERRGLTLMVGHVFVYSAAVRMIRSIIDSGDLGDIRYINSQRLSFGLYHNDINVVWDLAPHDLSMILYLLGRSPGAVNCQGHANITPGIEDVANVSLSFECGRFASIQSSWIEPRKVRQMTIVGSRKMIIYDDLEPLDKIRIYDTRIERPSHYETFGDFQYTYHYGDSHVPRIEQIEPLRQMCQHFIDCSLSGNLPLSGGESGLQVVRILEACSISLKANGGMVSIAETSQDRRFLTAVMDTPA
ncbi:MAG: Gfo/Idh/MocA family oxidoreductase [Verrucomicrobiota bacterium]